MSYPPSDLIIDSMSASANELNFPRARRHHSTFFRDSLIAREMLRQAGVDSLLRNGHHRRRNEASQDLLFACVSFVLLLAAAVADFIFHL